ncbi:Abi-alpha family protein [Chryseobacterium sediminis]|uniref:Abi-alpha family protein n=1 Tax=Chryseobacterium sediminis TaxID=1679494 RepID=UPI00142F26E4|nr:Abi-alpha family protein [Chryseobacterium sediminis]
MLEYSALEEDDNMQTTWAILLSNLVDSEQNIENHVFPYILSQLSKDEFFPLEAIYNKCIARRLNLSIELENFQNEKSSKTENIKRQIEIIKNEIQSRKSISQDSWDTQIWKLEVKIMELERSIKNLDYEEINLKHSVVKFETIPENLFKDFEISNVIRLGLVKEVKEFYAESQTLEIPIDKDDEYVSGRTYANVDLEIEVDSTTEYILTELGELFFKACKVKN